MRQGAIVGQYECAFDVAVEPAHRIHAHREGDEIGDDRPVVRIVERRDVAAGFVEEDVVEPLRRGQPLAVDRDPVDRWIEEGGGIPGHGAVDRDAPLRDQPVTPPSRRQPRLGQNLVESGFRH